ncbi:MAG: BPL-N domain-containing protein [Propionibacteriaceae bacterium]
MSIPLALVYRGPAARPSACSDAVAELLRSSPYGFDVRFVGPRGELPLEPQILSHAAVYAQPGGGELAPAYRRMRKYRSTIRTYVAEGGSYLGFCLGGYLAGATPGFGLLPGDTDRYITSSDAVTRSSHDTLVEVRWRGQRRRMFFQDGPIFLLESDVGVTVLARYSNNGVAAVVAPFGRGRVAVVGPHPEATSDWFVDSGLSQVPALDLGNDLVDAVMYR